MTGHQAKTQISLGIWPVWSESSLCAQRVAKDPSFLQADSEDAVQTGRMPRLIWVFAGRKAILLVLSWGGSYVSMSTFYRKQPAVLFVYFPVFLFSSSNLLSFGQHVCSSISYMVTDVNVINKMTLSKEHNVLYLELVKLLETSWVKTTRSI